MVLICSTLKRDSQSGCMFGILIGGSDLLKHWKATHFLNACSNSDILISSDLCKHWRGAYTLDACSTILVSNSDLQKKIGEGLTAWMNVLSVVLIYSNTGDQLTFWIHDQPFLSVALLKHSRATHILDSYQWFLSVVLKYRRATYILDTWSAILVGGSDMFKHWRVTHNLDSWLAIFVGFWSAQKLEANSQPRSCSAILVNPLN